MCSAGSSAPRLLRVLRDLGVDPRAGLRRRSPFERRPSSTRRARPTASGIVKIEHRDEAEPAELAEQRRPTGRRRSPRRRRRRTGSRPCRTSPRSAGAARRSGARRTRTARASRRTRGAGRAAGGRRASRTRRRAPSARISEDAGELGEHAAPSASRDARSYARASTESRWRRREIARVRVTVDDASGTRRSGACSWPLRRYTRRRADPRRGPRRGQLRNLPRRARRARARRRRSGRATPASPTAIQRDHRNPRYLQRRRAARRRARPPPTSREALAGRELVICRGAEPRACAT